VFGFLRRWKLKRALKRALKEVRSAPNPRNTAHLMQCYMDLGMFEEAENVGRQARKLYPLSATVKETMRRLKRIKYDQQIRQLRERIRRNPNPTSYAMLAELYRDIGETEKTLELCREAMHNFPTHEGVYLIVGAIRYERYLKNRHPKDGVAAVENFEKALKLNNSNYKVLRCLGQLYLELGMPRKAMEKLRSALSYMPNEPQLMEMVKQAREMPPESDDDVEEHFKALYERYKQQAESQVVLRFGLDELNAIFARLPDLEGAYLLVAMTKDGRRLASRQFAQGIDENVALRCMKAIFDVTNDACLRMDIGPFVRGIFTGKTVRIHMFRFDDMLVGLFVYAKVHKRTAEQFLNDLIEEEFYAYRESG